MTKPIDFRLLYIFLLGLSGAMLLFGFVISTSVVEAFVASSVGLAITQLVAWRALPPWQGSHRDKVLVLAVGILQLALVITAVAVIK